MGLLCVTLYLPCISYQSTLTGPASGGAGQLTSHTQLLTSQSKPSHFLIHRRFCNDPYDLEMIIEIIDTW